VPATQPIARGQDDEAGRDQQRWPEEGQQRQGVTEVGKWDGGHRLP
jgi:hypothetical protein